MLEKHTPQGRDAESQAMPRTPRPAQEEHGLFQSNSQLCLWAHGASEP